MIVKCIINHGKDLDPIFLKPEGWISAATKFYITINNYYVVYGMTLYRGYVWYYIDQDYGSSFPFWHPSGLFEVANSQLSSYWVYSFVQKKSQTILLHKLCGLILNGQMILIIMIYYLMEKQSKLIFIKNIKA